MNVVVHSALCRAFRVFSCDGRALSCNQTIMEAAISHCGDLAESTAMEPYGGATEGLALLKNKWAV